MSLLNPIPEMIGDREMHPTPPPASSTGLMEEAESERKAGVLREFPKPRTHNDFQGHGAVLGAIQRTAGAHSSACPARATISG